MPEPLNPNFCCGCSFWNYRCTAPKDQPCENVTHDDIFLRTAHTRKDVDNTIRKTMRDIKRKAKGPLLPPLLLGLFATFEHHTSKEEGILDQGNYLAAGLSLGAAIPLGRWLRLDLSTGFGPRWTFNKHYVNYNIQGEPILTGSTTALRWKAADAQVGVKYIFHKNNPLRVRRTRHPSRKRFGCPLRRPARVLLSCIAVWCTDILPVPNCMQDSTREK